MMQTLLEVARYEDNVSFQLVKSHLIVMPADALESLTSFPFYHAQRSVVIIFRAKLTLLHIKIVHKSTLMQ